MTSTTIDDIYKYRNLLVAKATELLDTHAKQQPYEMDDWYTVVIDELEFDLNVFDWELEDETPIVVVTAHTVAVDDYGNVSTNGDEWVRLLTKNGDTITEEIK